MSIFRSLSRFVTTTLDTATDSVASVNHGLGAINHKVEKYTKQSNITTTEQTRMNVARFKADLESELDADAKLKAQYIELGDDW